MTTIKPIIYIKHYSNIKFLNKRVNDNRLSNYIVNNEFQYVYIRYCDIIKRSKITSIDRI